jgi:hypothetical protein
MTGWETSKSYAAYPDHSITSVPRFIRCSNDEGETTRVLELSLNVSFRMNESNLDVFRRGSASCPERHL